MDKQCNIYTHNGKPPFKLAVIAEDGQGFSEQVFDYLKNKYELNTAHYVEYIDCILWPPDDLQAVLQDAKHCAENPQSTGLFRKIVTWIHKVLFEGFE